MAILQATVQVLMGAQTEIAIFIIAICVHTLLFNDRLKPVLSKLKQPKKNKNKQDALKGCSKADHARLPRSSNVLVRSIKQLIQQGVDQDTIVHELEYHLAGCTPEDKTTMLLDTLEHVGRTCTSQYIMAVRVVLQKHNLKPRGRFGELILRSLVALHMHEEFNEVAAEMEGTKDATIVTAVLSLRAALASSDFETAFARIRGFADQWRASTEQTPSVAPHGLMQQVVHLAGEKGKLLYLFQGFHESELVTSRLFELVLAECVRRGEIAVMKKIEEFARSHNVEITKVALCLLVRGVGTPSEVLKFYDTHLFGIDVVCADTLSAKHVAAAAFHGQRLDILEQMLMVSKDTSKQVALFKSFATEGRMMEATKIFNACPEKNTCLYNALLDAHIECHDVKEAERIMSDATVAGMADVVTYNTMIKAHLQVGDAGRARAAVETMRAAGLAPNSITYNELIDATAKTNIEDAWRIIGEMEECGLKPNQITCSILLKRIQQGSRAIDIERIFSFFDSISDEMDEVLLSSMVEACVRAGKTDLITKCLSRQRTSKAVYVKGAHTYGSLIRAHGFVKDLSGAWEMWHEMLGRHIVPTSITIGCMVEALVLNGDTDRGYELIQELLRGEQTRPLVNAVIYCSVLKGFSHQKRFDCVWAVYKEMFKEKIQLSVVTYNALVDACARCNHMEKVQPLLEDMCAQKIELNIWTYSTILKGYCNDGRIEEAFKLLEDMKKTKEFQPDEITYNILLDGCARAGLYTRGIALLHDMEKGGVAPSNFTLSVLAKLCNRSRRADKAFEHCEQIASKYNIRMNVHVYNNLIQAGTMSGALTPALSVFEQMLREGVKPDPRTYQILLRSCIFQKQPQDAASLLRTAVGMRHGGHPNFTSFSGSMTTVRGGLSPEIIEQTLEGIADQCGEQELAVQLLKELRHQPGVRLNSTLSVQLTSKAIKTTKTWS